MSVRNVLQGDVPELRRIAERVTDFNEQLHELLDDMTETMREFGGIGLAAPQIGCTLRVFVTDIGNGVLEFVNPEITTSGDTQASVESCLSFPGVTLKLQRPAQVTVQALDRDGRPFKLDASGLLARAICHEVDHLNGVLFMDQLTDDEVFQQMFMNIGASLEEALDEAESASHTSGNALEDDILRGRWEEVGQAVDMLADASWKVTLAVELLADHAELLDASALKAVRRVDQRLQEAVTELEHKLPADVIGQAEN